MSLSFNGGYVSMFSKHTMLYVALAIPVIFFSTCSVASVNIMDSKRICLTPLVNSVQLCEVGMPGFSQKSIEVGKEFNYSENIYKSTDATKKNTDSVIYNYIQTPEKDSDLGSYLISLIAMIISVGIPIWQRYVQKNDAINEGFWVREVVMPQVNSNMFNACSTFRSKLELPSDEFTQAYKQELLPSLNELRDSFSLLTAFPNAVSYPAKLNELCDDLEDKVVDHISEPINVRKEDISSFQLTLTKELIKIHKKIS